VKRLLKLRHRIDRLQKSLPMEAGGTPALLQISIRSFSRLKPVTNAKGEAQGQHNHKQKNNIQGPCLNRLKAITVKRTFP
jgi:hypothetical protein